MFLLMTTTGCDNRPVVISGSSDSAKEDIPRAGPPLKPSTDDLILGNASPTDLMVGWTGDPNVIEGVVGSLDGSIVLVVKQLNIYVARFNTKSATELQQTLNLLREHGYDASFDLRAPVMKN